MTKNSTIFADSGLKASNPIVQRRLDKVKDNLEFFVDKLKECTEIIWEAQNEINDLVRSGQGLTKREKVELDQLQEIVRVTQQWLQDHHIITIIEQLEQKQTNLQSRIPVVKG